MPTASRSSSKATRAKARKNAVRKKAMRKDAIATKPKPAKASAAKASAAKVTSKVKVAKVSSKGGPKRTDSNAVSVKPKLVEKAAKAIGKRAGSVSKTAKAQVPSKAKAASKATQSTKRDQASVKPAKKVEAKRTPAQADAAKPAKRAAKAVARATRAKTAASKPRRGPQLDSGASKTGRGARAERSELPSAEQLKFGFQDERSEVAVLQKQNRNLLLQIAKRRALITVSKQAVDELMRELSDRVIPYREELFSITRELCDLRDRLLDSSGLPSSQLEKVRWALHEMLVSLPVEEAEDAEDSAVAASDAAREAESASRAQAAEATDAQSAAASDAPRRETSSTSQSDSASEPAEYEFAARTGVSTEAAQREAPSAAKPTGDQSGALRTLFKKLAITYHPDRVQDEVVKAARTKIMKELTLAFESGDLARLLELERTLAARASGQEIRETPEVQAKKLTQSNLALRTQLRELEVELDRVKEDCPFTLDMRARDPARIARDELDQLVLDRHLEVERASKTREFVASFAAGRMKVVDFLKGPPHLRRLSEAQLAQMM